MRRILNDLKIMILANLWIVPVLAGLVGALLAASGAEARQILMRDRAVVQERLRIAR